MADELQLRATVVATARQLHEQHLVIGTSGNVSGRVPTGRQFWITPTGFDYHRLTPDNLVCVDLDGRIGEGQMRPSSDTMNHAAIYRARADVGGIVHTHSTYATVFAVLRQEIPPLLAEAAGFFGGPIRVIDYLPPATPELGPRAAEGLGQRRAVLLPNHGVIATGEDVEAALTAAQLVEQSARIAFLARLLGEPIALPQSEIERLHHFHHHQYGQR